MTVYEAQPGDRDANEGQGDKVTAKEPAPKLHVPGKVTLIQAAPDSGGSTSKMAVGLKPLESAMDIHLMTMISELSVSSDRRQQQQQQRPSCHDQEDEEDEVGPHGDDESDQEPEELLYTDRGPMMGGRHPNNRKHPYEMSGGGSGHGEAMSPSSSSEANDSESSMMSSPGSSPRHSVSIQIPSRPHIGSFGMVTVVMPMPQPRLSADSPEPVDPTNKRRQSLCTGGGMVTPESSVEQQQQQQHQQRKVSPSDSQQQQQSLLAGLPFPMLTIVPTGTITIQQPSSSGQSPSQQQYGNVVDEAQRLSTQSPYSTYRDAPMSRSPVSVHSPSADDSSVATPSPLSDIGTQQPSPYGSVDLQEQFDHNSIDGIAAFQSLFTKSFSSGPDAPPPPLPPISDVNVDSDLVPFPDCNFDEIFKSLVDDDGVPDKREVYEMYGSITPKESDAHSSRGEDRFVVPQKLPLPSRHQEYQQPHCSAHIRRCSNPDIETKIMEKMNSFKKILPKNDAVMIPASKPASMELPTVVLCTEATRVNTQVAISGQFTSSVPLVEKFANAVDHMRSLSTVDERNNALVKVEQLAIDDLCKPDDNGNTYLHNDISQRNAANVYAIVNRLIEKKRSLDIGNKFGQTPLFMAVVVNHLVFVEFLLHHGANAGCICRDGTTPLHVVASRGDSYYEVAKLLCSSKTVKHGHRNSKGLTALHCAVQSQHRALRIGQLFARCGSSLTDQEYCSGKTPMHLAVEKGDIEMVKLLCEAVPTAKVESALRATNYVQDTPLHSAAMIRDLSADDRFKLIKVLLAFGANPAMKNKEHKLPRDLLPPDATANKAMRKALDPKSSDLK